MAFDQQMFDRLIALSETHRQNPGRAPGGTGRTGILAGDRRGYDSMLGEREEFLSLMADFEGKKRPDVNVGYAGNPGHNVGPIGQTPPALRSLYNKSAFGLPAKYTRRDVEGAEDKFRV